jgi:hypothetical protein
MVVIDAELQEGEIGQLAQAIQGAFGGRRVIDARLNGPVSRSLPGPDSGEAPTELDGVPVAEVVEHAGPADTEPPPARPKVQKKIRTPNLDADLDPGEDPSLKAYADARNVTGSTSVLTKFLIAASWLHEQRNGMSITADRAYTCFRFVGWPCNIDFYQPLRDLRAKNKFLDLKGKGEFSVNLLGLDKASKMRVAS